MPALMHPRQHRRMACSAACLSAHVMQQLCNHSAAPQPPHCCASTNASHRAMATPATLQGHTWRKGQAAPIQQALSSLDERCRPIVIRVGGVPVLHFHQERGEALLVQLQHAGKALPLHEVVCQA